MAKYLKGRFSPKNWKKYKGDPTKIIFRSSWELKLMKEFDGNSNILQWCSEEIVIPYFDPSVGHWRRYFPDFWIRAKDKTGAVKTMLLEIKPEREKFPPKVPKRKTKRYIAECATYERNQSKWQAAEKYCFEKGWEFKVLTENDIGVK